jgi:alkaline phosphatase
MAYSAGKLRVRFREVLILVFAVASFGFFSGLGGCDNGPSLKDTSSTEPGTPVDVSGNPPPPGGETPGDGPTGPAVNNSPVKNIILLVGSGMGPQQIGQIVQFHRLRMSSEEPSALEKLMAKKYMGMVSTHSYLDIVSDTAAANSAMACGHKIRNNTVAIDANGEPCETVLEKAEALGKATGLVSNTKLSDPGIAAYAAHRLSRQEENEIASDVLSNPNINLILAGGMENLLPQSMKMSDLEDCNSVNSTLDGSSSRQDDSNLVETAKDAGYKFACNLEQLNGVTGAPLLGVFANGRFPLGPDRKPIDTLPSLAQMTGKALEILGQEEKGFLLVVHGGLTNIAAQDNDAGSLLQEGLDFDAAVGVAMEYAEQNPDTLLLLTSDHDTGGFSFAASDQRSSALDLPSGDRYEAPYNYAPLLRFDLLNEQNKSFESLTTPLLERLYGAQPDLDLDSASAMLVNDVEENTSYSLSSEKARTILDRTPGSDNARTQDFSEFYLNDNIHTNLLGRAVSRQTSTVWSSGTPNSTPVLVLATGPEKYASRVRGFLDNTEIGKIISDALYGN